MRLRTKEEALSIIHSCSKEYKRNLANKCLLFITTRNADTVFFEAAFMPHNFKHLTGIITKLSGLDFYNLAVKNRLSPREIILANDGTTDLKLDVLPQLMRIHTTARMVGEYDQSKSFLVTDKVAGTITAAMGFIQTNGMYLPNTALKKDVREVTKHATRYRVAAIFAKHRHAKTYSNLTYIAKGLSLEELLPANIDKYVDLSELKATFPIPQKQSDVHE